MKSLLLILAFIGIGSMYSFGQSNYEIKTLGTSYSVQQIEAAFGSAQWCGFIYLDKRNVIQLNDGSVIELLSANETSEKEDQSCIASDATVFQSAVWSISTTGKVVRKLTYNSKQ